MKILKDYVDEADHDLLIELINGHTIEGKIWFKDVAIKLVHSLWFLSKHNLIVADKKNIALWLHENWLYQKRGANYKKAFDFETYRVKISHQELSCKNPIDEILRIVEVVK